MLRHLKALLHFVININRIMWNSSCGAAVFLTGPAGYTSFYLPARDSKCLHRPASALVWLMDAIQQLQGYDNGVRYSVSFVLWSLS